MSELLGKSKGASQGRGGSIYIYNKNTNFYGGHGVIGAQISLGTGLAFALKYQKKKNVAAILFGDGAANQGQLN
jgi:pyruvate dehydrogenase E1 component alpha subunit